jgi:hypothetical protein
MLTVEQISQMAISDLAKEIEALSTDDIIYLFDELSAAMDDLDTQDIEFDADNLPKEAQALSKFLDALTMATVAGDAKRYQVVADYMMEHLATETTKENQEFAQHMLNEGYDFEYVELLTAKMQELPKKEAIFMALMEHSTKLVERNPDEFRYATNKLPIEIQDHFDNIEKIFKTVAKIECFANVYLVSANKVTGSKSPVDAEHAIVRFEHSGDEMTFAFVMSFECMTDGQHWLDDHRETINNNVMQFIAQFI